MAVFKCKMCGGALEIGDASVAECTYCGTRQTLPKLSDDRRANLYDRANHFRRNNEFDKAMGIYEQILNEDNTDAEAYWSLVLCRYGIEYVEDPSSHKRIPTVNRAQFTSVFDDDNYKSALQYADGYQRCIYEEEAKAINEIQKGILAISQKEEPFDVFICYKETDNNGRRTPDSVLATELYHELTREGYKVFFSRITLEDKLGTAYEPYIFAALNSAKVMVVLGTKPEHFNAVWVKNEWSRYLALSKTGARKTLIPAYKDMDPYDLPEEFSHLQAQDMSKLGFMQDLVRGIGKLAQAQAPATTVTVKTEVAAGSVNIAPLLKRAFMFMEDGEWKSADEYCEKVLDIDPECGEAYLGKLMVEQQVRTRDRLKDCTESFEKSSFYQKAVRYGDTQLKAELQEYLVYNEQMRYGKVVAEMKQATSEREFLMVADKLHAFGDYADARQREEECRRKAEEAKKAEEAIKKAKEEQRILKKKKIKRRILTICACVAVLAALGWFVAYPGISYLAGDYIVYIEMYGVEEFTIPDSVTSIGDWAFADCDSLTTVTIPNSVTTIGEAAFCNCDSLTTVTIPDSVTTIGDCAFYDCNSLTSVTIPDSVTSISENAFNGCDALTMVTVPDSIIRIGIDAFFYCDSLTSITIGDNVTTIGTDVFYDCKSLTTVTIPDSVTTIGDRAFVNCASLTSVHISDLAAWCGIEFNDCDANPLYYGADLYLNGELVTNLVIPDSVTSIGDWAFAYCDSLTTVTVPDSVTTIGEYAFADCKSLTSVTIPDSVTVIEAAAFYNCISLTSVTIPDSVITIGDHAFTDCKSLTSVTIPDSVTTIGDSMFAGCDSLTTVTVPDSVTTIGDSAFYSCDSLTTVTIPDSVTTIGYYAFRYSGSLETIYFGGTKAQWKALDVYIPDGCTVICAK